MPQIYIFVTLNVVFSIHHDLFFAATFFFCTSPPPIISNFYRAYLINVQNKNNLITGRWQIILQ